MEDEREVARREIRELAGIDDPTDEHVDWWLEQAAQWQRELDPIEREARALILEHGRLAHHAVDGAVMAARLRTPGFENDEEERQAELERLRALQERVLDINRPWRKLLPGRRKRG